MLVSSGISVTATRMENKILNENIFENVESQPLSRGITNITVNESWDFLNGSCSIEIPIDVRRNDEWNPERIDTPIPEHPRHYCLDRLEDEALLEKFISLYDGMDIIVYCKKGGRSWKAANIINDAGFTGKIYNMVGGITEWKASMLPTAPGGILNITVNDVKLLCSHTNNGIQIPIDVRYDYEWYSGFIKTKWPECTVWYPKPLLETQAGLEEFLEVYEGNEVILYCKGGYRSLLSSYILMGEGFNGTIYNMLGGITAWLAEGFPIRNNTAPDAPNIDGPSKGGAGVNLTFELSTSDAENDGIYFVIDWNDTTSDEIGPFGPGVKASIVHAWEEKGTYTITAKAIDFYGNESNMTQIDIKIPRTRQSNLNLIEILFEKFPRISTIIKYLLG
jgi:rhodanese-related sulfurtransferase